MAQDGISSSYAQEVRDEESWALECFYFVVLFASFVSFIIIFTAKEKRNNFINVKATDAEFAETPKPLKNFVCCSPDEMRKIFVDVSRNDHKSHRRITRNFLLPARWSVQVPSIHQGTEKTFLPTLKSTKSMSILIKVHLMPRRVKCHVVKSYKRGAHDASLICRERSFYLVKNYKLDLILFRPSKTSFYLFRFRNNNFFVLNFYYAKHRHRLWTKRSYYYGRHIITISLLNSFRIP